MQPDPALAFKQALTVRNVLARFLEAAKVQAEAPPPAPVPAAPSK